MSTSNTFRRCSSCQSEMETFLPELDPAHREIYDDFCTKSRSNDIPNSEVERAQLQSLIERNSSDLQRYDDAIARLQDQRNQLDKIVQYQKSLISPIRKLSPDVLGEIFELVTTDQFINLEIYGSKARGIGRVFGLTWICSWWRKLILSRPTPWSRIQLRLDDLNAINTSQFINMMEEVLLRSGTTPLCLKLTRDDESYFSEFQLSVLDTLAGNTMYRCKDLEIRLNSFSQLDKLLSLLASGTHFELMKLSIVIWDTYRLETKPSRFLEHLSLNFPRLQTLKTPFLRLTDPIDLANLTILQIHVKIFGGYMRGLLERCPLLQGLWVSSFRSQNDTPPSLASVCHTHLTSLTVDYRDKQFPDGVWDYVQLPNLTFLSVYSNVPDAFFETRNSFNELKTMLKYSRCMLQNVDFLFVPDTAVSLFFQDVPVSPECRVEVDEIPYQVPFHSS
ncbi:hypothetical protein BT96DRAFT_1021118 [Gymnopus androsaceus JB14]|uniref:F-box domain-containing protein n=1 Tax=Gymnopus androsaceus JB14 TaxID=1447944 RepID=A0A6A4HH20_9AGAR|nr:hypothetical protein BT96DRAFT_1021118 [Gymnopus androsaceus JB14]